jgi:hypothetical protein
MCSVGSRIPVILVCSSVFRPSRAAAEFGWMWSGGR